MNSLCHSLGGMVLAGGYLKSVRMLTSGTYYQPSPGTANILVELVGGGGAGGGAAQTSPNGSAGGGGGGGGYSRRLLTNVQSLYQIAIGAAGAAGSAGANDGGTGGTTSFSLNGTVLLQATGGIGGKGCASHSTCFGVLGGAGGVGSLGTVNVNGSAGKFGALQWDNSNSSVAISGNGGNSGQYWGVGGIGIIGSASSANGNPGLGYGGGGSGGAGYNNGTVNQSGGAGTAGAIFIWEFASEPYDKIFGINNPSAKYGRLASFQYLLNTTLSVATDYPQYYSPTPGTKSILVEIIGGGGGGGGLTQGAGTYSASGAGGAAGYARKFIENVESRYLVQLGGSGAGQTSGSGITGGTTYFKSSNYLRANGGVGAAQATAVSTNSAILGGAGGTSSGGDLNLTGAPGEPGRVLIDNGNSQCVIGATGTDSALGNGTSATIRTTTGETSGNNPTGFGAGGTGCCCHTDSSVSSFGGYGSGGAIIVWEFK